MDMANDSMMHEVETQHVPITPIVREWEALGRVLIDMIIKGERPEGASATSGAIEDLEKYLNDKARSYQNDKTIDAVTFPDRLATYRIEQASWREFVLRLPAPNVGNCGHERACNPPLQPGAYEEPPFYKQFVNRPEPLIDSCQFFRCRVADYTMSMCK